MTLNTDMPLSLRSITKRFGDKIVLDGLDLQLEEGSVLGLLGRNGAGKSTMIKCALGLLAPDDGKAEIFGVNAWDLDGKTKHRIGYVPQVLSGFSWMRVRDMVDYTGSFYQSWRPDKVAALLDEWDLDPKDRLGQLSEGERQRLAIILAMGHDPSLLVFDEPVAGLDPAARRRFLKQLLELNTGEGKTVLFSTHITSDIERVAAEVALMKDGRIHYRGDLDMLKERVRRVYLTADNDLPQPLLLSGVLHQEVQDNRAMLTVDGPDDAALQAFATSLNARLRIESMNLEDIFLELNR
ncbi:MAG: ABC transporter ATP-binding protein [Acidobacteriota bacterium]|nr:ABC transporter ATP-binding protein [Acidobacteriota bacterium]